MEGPEKNATNYSDSTRNLLKQTVGQRIWKFRVSTSNLYEFETVCVTGDCLELGNWSHDKLVHLKQEDNSPFWSVTLKIPLKLNVHYRYCICMQTAVHTQVLIRRWETHLIPRKIAMENSQLSEEFDIFGKCDGKHKIERGWLTTDSVLQLKFSKNSINFKAREPNGTFSVKLTQLDNQCPILTEEQNNWQPPDTIIEVARVNSLDSEFKAQSQFGIIITTDEFFLFSVTVPCENRVSYLIDLYRHSHTTAAVHIGYSYILSSVINNSEGCVQLPITCTSRHLPLGMMKVEYLVVRPMEVSLCDMKDSYASHWKESWTGLDVGHRGSGSSFKTKESASIRENTIASLRQAAESGADMVEFDVQLSKDLIPVIYHDFHVCVTPKTKQGDDSSHMLEIPLMDLTLEQLKKLKVYHIMEGREKRQKFFDEDLADHQPFPLLSEAFKAIDQSVGFNIEIKWSLEKEDGTPDLRDPIDMNIYIDKILEVVLKSDQRRIVFSCFHPDVCTMLRLKQNKYPTMFLTQGVTRRYPKLLDPRCNSIQDAVFHAINAGLLGVVVHTEDLLRDPTQVKWVIDAGLIIFCWGNDNNSKDTIRHLKQLGLHGVIFDKMDQYSTKEIKESVFMIDARNDQEKLLPLDSKDIENGQGDTLSYV